MLKTAKNLTKVKVRNIYALPLSIVSYISSEKTVLLGQLVLGKSVLADLVFLVFLCLVMASRVVYSMIFPETEDRDAIS